MALNPEVAGYAQRIDAATNDIAADIQRILDSPTTSLSDEDRQALELVVGNLDALGAENVPPPTT
jgi:hypothetical protein